MHIGVWGQHHRRYLKGHHKIAYTRLLTSGKLNRYLADIDHIKRKNCSLWLVSTMDTAESITETLKADDQMKWAHRTNSIQNRAGEIVESELIYY